MTPLQKRCIELSYQHKLTHVSSVLNTVDVIGKIYDERAEDDPFVLGNSHAALALFVVLEKHGLCDAAEMVIRHGTHAARDMEHGVWVSGGSLGQAETVAVGMALANPEKRVYLVTSDGACMEGSVWEAFRIIGDCSNLEAHIIFNGHGAYGPVSLEHIRLLSELAWAQIHHVQQSSYPEWLRGLPGHYLTLTEAQYKELMNEA
jgi:transketolase N-terminal domain/subunit